MVEIDTWVLVVSACRVPLVACCVARCVCALSCLFWGFFCYWVSSLGGFCFLNGGSRCLRENRGPFTRRTGERGFVVHVNLWPLMALATFFLDRENDRGLLQQPTWRMCG